MSSTPGRRPAWRCPSPTPRLADAARSARMQVVEHALAGHVAEPRGASSPRRPRTCSPPAASGSGRCWCCWPPRPARDPDADEVVTAACVVELTHLGLALPRRRDGRGRAAPRRRLRQRALGQPRRDPHRRLPVLEVLGADRRARPPTPSGSRPRRSPGSSRARSSRPSPPGRGEDPLAHYLDVVAGKTGSLIATSARYGARFGGAPARGGGGADGVRRDRRLRLPALRRHPRHRLRLRRVRQDPRHRPARGRPDAAGADGARLDRPGRRPAARAARRRPHRRRPARRGARPAARAPGARPGPGLRRRPGARGEGAARRAARRPGPRGARGLRRRGRPAPLSLSPESRPAEAHRP